MAWQFIYRDTFLFSDYALAVRIPILFNPFYRLAINAKLISGLGNSVKSLGTVYQLLFIDGLGDVKGASFPLAPNFQLLAPTTEFNFRLIYQPTSKPFSVELSIWKDTELMQSGGDGVVIDNTAVFTAISDQLGTLAESETTTQGTLEILHTGLIALTNAQGVTANQLTALATSEAESKTQILASLGSILAVLSLPVPTPTPTPTPTPAPAPTVSTIPYVVSQSSSFNGRTPTYAALTDGTLTYQFQTNSYGLEWFQATFPAAITPTSVGVGGGYDPTVGPSTTQGASLEYSIDGNTWTSFATVNRDLNTGDPLFVATLSPPITARYWRISKRDYLAITEFRFYP